MGKKFSVREITVRAKISKSSVARYVKQLNKPRGHQDKKKRLGRPKILSDRDVRRLRRSIVLLRNYNANFTVKELIQFSGLNYSSASYATFYREILRAGLKFVNSRRKGVLSDSDCKKRYKFAQKCRKMLKTKPDLFHSDISFYLDGVSFIFKTKPNHDASVPQGKI
jgi:transposase